MSFDKSDYNPAKELVDGENVWEEVEEEEVEEEDDFDKHVEFVSKASTILEKLQRTADKQCYPILDRASELSFVLFLQSYID